MRHVSLDTQEEAVKRFVLALAVDPAGSVLEFGGKAVAYVMPPPHGKVNGAGGPWTEAKDDRRCALIDKKYDAELTPAEDAELGLLQAAFYRHLDQTAPLPIEEARKLHKTILGKAAKAKGRS